jgi:hypothetical protein
MISEQKSILMPIAFIQQMIFFFLAALGFELKAYTLSHPASIFVIFFFF